ncbi:MAG: transcriptional repressor, partial [Methyloversatilis sp.]|nr:transcriptional repressor [Methyloversatilis sp.]
RRQIKVAKERGFTVHDHALTIFADCSTEACPNKRKTTPRG